MQDNLVSEAKAEDGVTCDGQPPAYSIVKVSIEPGALDDFLRYVEGHLPSVATFGGSFRAATLGAPVQPEVIEAAHLEWRLSRKINVTETSA